MIQNKIIKGLIGLLISVNLYGQVDTGFVQQKLSSSDLINHPPMEESKVYAAGRILEDPKELPQTIYIITKQEIIDNGFFTLVDVLKTLPGFRTSQPGSDLLGETFLMRGLIGNSHAKILINGLPVKPYSVAGMPLGAQLPIRQAERIEVILGPSSALYGSDAMAGVINIVMPEIKRPIEIGTDLTLGFGGASQLDIAISGKLGKAKNTFTYSLFGTQRTVANYDIEDSQFSVDSLSQASPFYVGSQGDNASPEIRNLKHTSQLLGGRLKFRGLTLTSSVLSRSDHAALGTDPGVIAYNDPGTYMAENIYFEAIEYQKAISEKITGIVNASFIYYKVDDNSSYIGINHPLSNGKNYIYADSYDWSVEPILNYSHGRFNVLVGGKYQYAEGTNYQGYLKHPNSDGRIFVDSLTGVSFVINSADSFSIIEETSIEDKHLTQVVSGFAQVFYKSRILNAQLGFRYEKPTSTDGVLSPSFGLVVKATEKLVFKTSLASAYQIPSPYYEYNYYAYMNVAGTTSTPVFNRMEARLDPERLVNFEIGVSCELSKTHTVSANFFRHTRSNSLMSRVQTKIDTSANPPPGGYRIGFVNRTSNSILSGYSLASEHEWKSVSASLSAMLYVGEENIDQFIELGSYRSVPDYSLCANVNARIKEKTKLGFNVNYFGPFVNHVVEQRGEVISGKTSPYYNIDLVFTRNFTKNLQMTVKVINVTNTITKGVFTHWLTIGRLDYIPQLTRWAFISLNYRLN